MAMAIKSRKRPSKGKSTSAPDAPQLRDSVRTRIKETLLERIVDGTYDPGQRLKELEIAREFNTSQAPVREALRELEAVGLIETKYYQGSRVRTSSHRELEQAYLIRASLEELAARTAAEEFKSKTMKLRKIVDKLTMLADRGRWKEYTHYNYLFHRSIIIGSGNSLLLKVWDSLHFEFRTRISLSDRSAHDTERIAREHYQIIDALDSGDGKRAGRILKAHSLMRVKDLRQSRSAHRANSNGELDDEELNANLHED
jgi:DNA-binding GntR family transcriptional regulator